VSSGSCDPCPGPTLDATDLATLGADVIGSTYAGANPNSYTLTRLHARYGKTITDDLVFRAVGDKGERVTPVHPANEPQFWESAYSLRPAHGCDSQSGHLAAPPARFAAGWPGRR
jgi:hypothetical protein